MGPGNRGSRPQEKSVRETKYSKQRRPVLLWFKNTPPNTWAKESAQYEGASTAPVAGPGCTWAVPFVSAAGAVSCSSSSAGMGLAPEHCQEGLPRTSPVLADGRFRGEMEK